MRLLSLTRSVLCLGLAVLAARAADLRVGMIGLDTSHAVAFARILNDPANPEHVAGAKIVAAFKGGSPDIPKSISRVEGFVNDLKKFPEIVIYDSIAELVKNVDAVMILSVDGRAHLAQAKAVFPSGKPVFIDKPVAGSLRDVLAIFQLAKETGAPCFSSSSLRYNTASALKGEGYGDLQGAFTYGPAEIEPHHPDLYWYGIHAVEMLYTVMGQGCTTVVRTHANNTDIVTGTWSDGRVGTMRGNRGGKSVYGVTVFGSAAVISKVPAHSYAPLVQDMVKFFQTRIAPVAPAETIELLAFMEAADESKRRGGAPVAIADVMAANRPAK